jgi:membrane dipeptidase
VIPLGPVLAALLVAPVPWCDRERGAVDLHVDLPFQVHYRERPADLREPGGDVSAESLRRGCVRTLVLSLFVPGERVELDELLDVLAAAERIVQVNGWSMLGEPGEVAVVFSIEGSAALLGELDAIPRLVARGVRLFGLVHARHNALAESSSDPHPHAHGLSEEGRAFVQAVYDAGALVDVSHASDATFDDVATIARAKKRPLVATHSNARALSDHRRNLTDAQLRTIADTKGVVGVAFHAPFLRRAWKDASAKDFARHVAHMIEVMGPSHVAIGSDLDGLITPAQGLASHAGLWAIAMHVRAEGIDEAALAGLMGGNALRVLETATKRAVRRR